MASSYYLSFNGNSWLSTAASASNSFASDFTVEAWIRLNTISGSPQSIFGVGAGSTNFDFRWFNGSLQVSLNSGSGSAIGGTVSASTWTHVALVRSGSTVRCFVNGAATGTQLTNSGTLGNSSGAAFVGASDGTTSPSNRLNGDISNLRVVRGTAVYTSNFTVPSPPLTAISNTVLLTAQDPTITDRSSQSRTLTTNGTVTSNIWVVPPANLGPGIIMSRLSSYGSSPATVGSVGTVPSVIIPSILSQAAGAVAPTLNAAVSETSVCESLNSTEMDWNRILWLTRA
jgi:hypothetical protein